MRAKFHADRPKPVGLFTKNSTRVPRSIRRNRSRWQLCLYQQKRPHPKGCSLTQQAQVATVWALKLFEESFPIWESFFYSSPPGGTVGPGAYALLTRHYSRKKSPELCFPFRRPNSDEDQPGVLGEYSGQTQGVRHVWHGDFDGHTMRQRKIEPQCGLMPSWREKKDLAHRLSNGCAFGLNVILLDFHRHTGRNG